MITRLQYKARRLLHRFRHNSDQLRKLGKAPHPRAADLAAVLEGVLMGIGREDELALPRQRRNQLLAMDSKSMIRDHGAGRPELNLSHEEMLLGRMVEEDLGELARTSSVPDAMARLLYLVVQQFKPELSLELGSCMGLSTCCIGRALEDNGSGHLISMEGDPVLARIARESLESCNINCAEIRCGTFQSELSRLLPTCDAINFFFNDGVHEEHNDWEMTTAVLKIMPDNSLLLLDDIDWSEGMKRFWARIQEHPRIALSVSLFRSGLLLTGSQKAGRFTIAVD